jgi:hypothetical protein
LSPYPLSPAAASTISILIRLCIKEISDVIAASRVISNSGSGNTSTNTTQGDVKSDVSFVNFLVDVLGGLGSRVREVSVTVQGERERAEAAHFPPGNSHFISYFQIPSLHDVTSLHVMSLYLIS